MIRVDAVVAVFGWHRETNVHNNVTCATAVCTYTLRFMRQTLDKIQ
jgi:hypothetical protein